MTDSTRARSWPHYTEPEFVDVDGLRVAYRRKGQGEAAVYLHGNGFTRMWLPFHEELSRHLDLIVPEHPGYGDSEIDDRIQSFDDLVLFYDELLDALDVEPVHLIGHDLGGWLAADLAVFYPRRFASLTLITPLGLRLPGAQFIDLFRMTPEELLAAQFNGRGADYAEYLEQEGDPDDLIRAMVEGAVAARLMWNPRYDYRLDHRLSRVSVPSLVVGAEDDRMAPTAMAARYAELIPTATLETVVGSNGPSGHLPLLEQPIETAALILDHVSAVGDVA